MIPDTNGRAYTMPEISIANPKDWYIWFRYTYNGKEVPRKFRDGINRIKNKVERMIQAEKNCQKYTDWLKAGWNPITDPEFKVQCIKPTVVRKDIYIQEGLTFAFGKKKLAGKSKSCYKSMLDFIQDIAVREGYHLLPLSEFDRGVCLNLIDECAKVRKFTNHNYNKHVAVLRSMFGELVQYKMLNANPLTDYREKEVAESNKYEDYTPEEKRRIHAHLTSVHPQMFTIMSIVYHTGIRPKEVLALRVEDINLKTLIITIAPEEGAENSKTLSIRRVPINPHLEELLGKMNLGKYPGHCFAFGAPLPRNCGSFTCPDGRRVHGAMRPDYFLPHPYPVKRDTITKLWKKLVMDDAPTGLGIKKHLYAAKHTGTDDKTDAGLELEDVQVMYGHKSAAMTARYNKRKREREAKKEILEKSPAFSA